MQPLLFKVGSASFHNASTPREDTFFVVVLRRVVARVARAHAVEAVIEEPRLRMHPAVQRLVRFERPELYAFVEELQEPQILRGARGLGDLGKVQSSLIRKPGRSDCKIK